MKGVSEVIDHLNGILTNELTAVNQYFLHARILKNWGIERLASHVYEESIGEMKHADGIIERVLLLEGLPNLQNLHKLKIGENVPEVLRADLSVEVKNRGDLQAAIGVCEKNDDFVSRVLLSGILDDTEEHIDWIETQLELIEKVGVENYISQQMHSDDA